MPLHKVSVFKRLDVGDDLRHWSNVYRVEADDITEALDHAVSIANIEQAVHKDYVIFSKVTARLDVPDAPEGGTRALVGSGDVTGDPTLRLPRFNTIRAVLTDDVGRPDQKYLRLPLQEDDVIEGTINVAVSNLVSLSYVAPLIALAYIRSADNTVYTAGDVIPAIQMRQISWSRRARPGFHRAYVPD